MKFDVEELSATKKKIKVEISAEDVDRALEKAYVDLNANVKVDGFRPGKAPRSILEKRYSESVEADVLEKLVPQYYYQAVSEAKAVPVETPTFEEKELKVKKGQPLTFTALVEVRPEFELAEYKGVAIKDEKPEVTEEELSEALEEIREVHSTLETIDEDRPAQKGDHVIIDFEGFVDGKPLEGGKAENYALALGTGTFIPGFEEQLEGAKSGEEREVNVRFPDDYKSKDLAGKDAVFKVKVGELKKKVKAELDGELAKDLGLGSTLEELKEKVSSDLRGYKEQGAGYRQKEEIVQELLKRNTFELPESLVEKELRALVIRKHQDLLRSGQTPSQAGFDLKAFEAETRPKAEERVKTALILAAVAEKEGISVSDGELESGLRRMAAEMGTTPQRIKELYEKKEGNLESIRAAMGEEKVLDFLLKEAHKI